MPQVQTVQGPVDTAPARAGVTDEQIETMLVGNPRRYSEDTGTY